MQLEERKQLRQTLRHRRRSLSAKQHQRAAVQLLKRLKTQAFFRTAKHIAIYLPNDGEIETNPIIQWCWQHNKHVYLPVLHPLAHNRLWFVRYRPRTAMTKNKYGILEPKMPFRFIRDARRLDLVLMPLVGFDADGGRLGMGGGYYDRTFAFIKQHNVNRPKLIGLAHELQRVDTLPIAAWDVPVVGVATDEAIYLN